MSIVNVNSDSQKLLLKKSISKEMQIVTSTRIPKDFFITTGIGQSDITIHAGSYHLALKDAGIERCNIMSYSSILPGIATEISKPNPDTLIHGSVLETIMAQSNATKGKIATAGIIFGWLYDKNTGKKYGGLVCEYSGNETEEKCAENLKKSLKELYANGHSEKFILKDFKLITKSFKPTKKYGTAIAALCFVNYVHPVLGITESG
jgi:arginine decarboxylase